MGQKRAKEKKDFSHRITNLVKRTRTYNLFVDKFLQSLSQTVAGMKRRWADHLDCLRPWSEIEPFVLNKYLTGKANSSLKSVHFFLLGNLFTCLGISTVRFLFFSRMEKFSFYKLSQFPIALHLTATGRIQDTPDNCLDTEMLLSIFLCFSKAEN